MAKVRLIRLTSCACMTKQCLSWAPKLSPGCLPGSLEVLQHGHELLAVAFRPDGKEIATASLDGQIHFWDPLEGALQVRVVAIH